MVFVRATTQRPAVLAVRFLNREVINTRNATTHKTVLVELPVFVAIRAKPIERIVMPLVGKAYRNS